jgi:hypothetical protein
MRHAAPRLIVVSSFLGSLLLVAASLVVVSLFAGGSRAAPAAGNGNGTMTGGGPINVTDRTYLAPFDDITTCYTSQGDYHFVYTPSGGYQAHSEAHHCFTVYPGTDTSAAPLSQLCGYDHNQFHTKEGEVQLVQETYGESYTDAAGNSFCYAAQYHEVNGVVQYDRFSTNCNGHQATPVA